MTGSSQTTLEKHIAMQKPWSREGLTKRIVKWIVCNDQVCAHSHLQHLILIAFY